MRSSSTHSSLLRALRPGLCAVSVAAIVAGLAGPASALSELPPADGKAPPVASDSATETPPPGALPGEVMGLPQPDPLINTPDPEDGEEEIEPTVEAPAAPPEPLPPVEVIYDIEKAPEPVRRMRELIVEAAASGDIARLRSLLNPGPNQTQIMSPGVEGDPVDAVKALSGDPEGAEILAIMLDILATGFVHVDAGTPEEAYVWPYFAEKSVTTLTAPEKVELLRIVTAGDFADMLEYGNYNFYRLGITPDGQWKFFTAGD